MGIAANMKTKIRKVWRCTVAASVVIVAIVAPFLRDHKAIDAETTEVLMDRHLLRVRWRSC